MHAHVFLDEFWRNDLKPEIFVAMDFDKEYDDRFENIFSKAIDAVTFKGQKLQAFRVNMDVTGDMIHSRIIDGIAHSQLVLADISKTRKFFDEKGAPRKGHNENVFYEVGMALAARQPSEVVLVREDHKELPFDLNSYPITAFDPSDYDSSIETIRRALQQRIDDRDLTNDLRVKKMLRSLSDHEVKLLMEISNSLMNDPREKDGPFTTPYEVGVSSNLDDLWAREITRKSWLGLLEKQIVKASHCRKDSGNYPMYYNLTLFGWALVDYFVKLPNASSPRFDPKAKENAANLRYILRPPTDEDLTALE